MEQLVTRELAAAFVVIEAGTIVAPTAAEEAAAKEVAA